MVGTLAAPPPLTMAPTFGSLIRFVLRFAQLRLARQGHRILNQCSRDRDPFGRCPMNRLFMQGWPATLGAAQRLVWLTNQGLPAARPLHLNDRKASHRFTLLAR